MTSGGRATIVEVGPRDGFQMERAFIPTDLKVATVDALSHAGLTKIEVTSFVNPRVIPQMADAADVLARITRRPGTSYIALVPNAKGAERALAAGVDGVKQVICVTETYNRRNVGLSVDESLRHLSDILAVARPTPVEAVVALAFGCPLEGEVPVDAVVRLVGRIVALGVREVSIADSVGLAAPTQVAAMMRRLQGEFPGVAWSLHLHDTRGLGLANVLAAPAEAVTVFDSSVGGLGGCRVVPGATGNIATEDLAQLLATLELATGVDIDAVRTATRRVEAFLGRRLPSRVLAAGTIAEALAGPRAPAGH